MSANRDALAALSLAIAKAAGIGDAGEFTAITYTHRAKDLPRIVVESAVWNPATLEIDHPMVEWVPLSEGSAAAELTALKARRCDGCASSQSWGADDEGVRCRLFSISVYPDHACNRWTAKP